jgi:hypothetical protein
MPYDYSSAAPPRDNIELIPAGTVASVLMRIRAGNAGEDGWLTRSKDAKKDPCEMLDCEFVLVDGPYARRKFWGNFVLEGTTAGHAKAAEISRGVLRSILKSARNIRPDNMSDQARAGRMADLKDFDNITFIARIGIEKGKPIKDKPGENYADKNILAAVITPDKKDWHPIEQSPPFEGGSAGTAATPPPSATPSPGVAKPSWAS